jgi:hypothetical protein
LIQGPNATQFFPSLPHRRRPDIAGVVEDMGKIYLQNTVFSMGDTGISLLTLCITCSLFRHLRIAVATKQMHPGLRQQGILIGWKTGDELVILLCASQSIKSSGHLSVSGAILTSQFLQVKARVKAGDLWIQVVKAVLRGHLADPFAARNDY